MARPATGLRGAAALAAVALAAPTLLAFNLPPSSTFVNQAAALIGWGGWLALLATGLTASGGCNPAAVLAVPIRSAQHLADVFGSSESVPLVP